MSNAGRLLIMFGAFLVLIGSALMIFARVHLPGDITVRTGGTYIYLPLATSLILSIVATVVLNLVFRQR